MVQMLGAKKDFPIWRKTVLKHMINSNGPTFHCPFIFVIGPIIYINSFNLH